MEIITPEEVKQRLAAGEKLNLVDVREPGEHADFNIGGILHPLGRIREMDAEGSGNRSGQACMMLETMGFTNVKNLVGGMLLWEETFGR